MSLPEVSFVVTVYNKRPYLPLLVKSLLSQRGLSTASEYIFIDDGSSDGSFELLSELTRGMHNVTLVQQENGGQTGALNTALQHATKPYIKLWDADDYVHPDLTASLVTACQTFGTDLAFCNTTFSPFAGPEQPDAIIDDMAMMEMAPAQLLQNAAKVIFRNPISNPTGVLVTRNLMDKIGTLDTRIVIADVYIPCAATMFTEFAHIDGDYAFVFRDVPGRLTANEAQILHDINGALYCLHENFEKQLSRRIKRYMGIRASGRAWKWANRHNGKSVFSGDFLRFLQSRLSPKPLTRAALYKTLLPFRQGGTVRTRL